MSEYDVLSIIGCVTGCGGLLISMLVFLRDVLKERHNFKIEFQDANCIFFKKIPELSHYLTEYQAILHVQMINKSSCPVTVRYLDTFIGNERIEFRPLELDEINIPFINNKFLKAHVPIYEHCKFSLPTRIDAYDVREFIIFYPCFPDFKQEILSGKLEIGTTKRKQHAKFKISSGPIC